MIFIWLKTLQIGLMKHLFVVTDRDCWTMTGWWQKLGWHIVTDDNTCSQSIICLKHASILFMNCIYFLCFFLATMWLVLYRENWVKCNRLQSKISLSQFKYQSDVIFEQVLPDKIDYLCITLQLTYNWPTKCVKIQTNIVQHWPSKRNTFFLWSCM